MAIMASGIFKKTSGIRHYRLVLLCYFVVFALIPLAHIHLEEGTLRTFSAPDESQSHAQRFLLILHEALFLHFKDRANHAFFSRSSLSEVTGRPGAMKSGGPSRTKSPAISTEAYALLRCTCACQQPPLCGVQVKTADGHDSFSSGLSPPSL